MPEFATYPSINGKTVFITGGATGIGAAMVESFAEQGAIVGQLDLADVAVLHGLLEGKSRDETINFAASSAQWAHSVPGDFLRATVADIEVLSRGGSNVKL